MIEPTQGVKKQSQTEPVVKDAARVEQEEREQPSAASEASAVQLAERQKQAPPPSPSFDVRLDGETMRLYSELRDPETDRVILRLPAGYQPESERSSTSTEA